MDQPSRKLFYIRGEPTEDFDKRESARLLELGWTCTEGKALEVIWTPPWDPQGRYRIDLAVTLQSHIDLDKYLKEGGVI